MSRLVHNRNCVAIIITLTKNRKIWLNELVHDSEIAIPEHVLYRLDRLGKISSGVCVCV